MDYSQQLEKAIEIATIAHMGQRRLDNTPYILHPLRVMYKLDNPIAQIIAVLHDVLEDTTVTVSELTAAGMDALVVMCVKSLTHDKNTTYLDYIQSIIKSPLAYLTVPVKLADITDNMRITQMPSLDEKDLQRIKKYHTARKLLLNAL